MILTFLRARCVLLSLVAASWPMAIDAASLPQGRGAGRARESASFVENRGQWSTSASFVGRWGRTVARAERGAIALQLLDARDPRRGVLVRLAFEGARRGAEPEGEQPLPGVFNYLLGKDPAKWRTDVPRFGSVLYRGLYDGVDLRVRHERGHLKYDLLVDPGARLEDIVIRCEGADGIYVDTDGALVIETEMGAVRQPVPETWETGPTGERHPVTCSYELRGAGAFGFAAPTRSMALPLVVDPGLVWASYVGASLNDRAKDVALGPKGEVTVIGTTNSITFPSTPGAFSPTHSGSGPPFFPSDAFVTQLEPDGDRLVFSTFLGGASSDRPKAVHVASDGAITVAGDTGSADFPTTPGAFDTTPTLTGKMFITRLDATGSALLFSTFLGGGDGKAEGLTAMHVDDAGFVTVTGQTASPSFPTTAGSFKPWFPGFPDNDAFVTRLRPDGSALVYSTLLGGGGTDFGLALDVEPSGAATVAGRSISSDFPVTPGAFDSVPIPSGISNFVTRLNPSGSGLIFSTFFGGDGSGGSEVIIDLRVDSQGATTVAGYTGSLAFPVTPGAYDTVGAGSTDGFVSRLDPTGSTLLFSTLLGVGGSDYLRALHVDSAGVSTVFGATTSAAFPTTPGAYQTTKAGPIGGPGTDCFVSRLSADGSTLLYSTFLGGSDDDADDVQAGERLGLAVGPFGDAYVAASTESTDFPTTPGAWQEADSPFHDGFVACLDMLPAGVAKYGTSTPACAGPIAIGVTKMPRAGEPSFGLTSTNGPVSAPGILLVGVGQDAAGTDVLGASVHLTPAAPFAAYVASSNTVGHATSTHAIPLGAAGAQVFAQFLWLDPSGCGPLLSASNALAVTVQP